MLCNNAPKKPLPVAFASGPTQKKSLALIQAVTFNDVQKEKYGHLSFEKLAGQDFLLPCIFFTRP